MSQIDTLLAPFLPAPPEDKWRSEQRAFRRLLPEVLKTHRGQYVAIHQGQVVESGPVKSDVAGRAYARFERQRYQEPKAWLKTRHRRSETGRKQ